MQYESLHFVNFVAVELVAVEFVLVVVPIDSN